MTEHTARSAWASEREQRIQKLIERIIRRSTRFVEKTVRDTSRMEERVHRAAERARSKAEQAEERAARLNEKIQRRAARGNAPEAGDELRNLGLEIERQALAAVEAALREIEQQLAGIDVEAVTRRVEEQLASIDAERIGRQAEQALREASVQIQLALDRRGYVAGDKGQPIAPEPVSDEERLAVLQMVQSGTISAEEAETLLDALDGSDK